jgi:hypothetical protein
LVPLDDSFQHIQFLNTLGNKSECKSNDQTLQLMNKFTKA